jgi:alkylhydroperoxidase/carboxymuconolactone decarboxylase family protein YurZ
MHFAVSVAIGYEFGAKHHLAKASECGATEDEITETIVYTMRPAAAKLRNFGNTVVSK